MVERTSKRTSVYWVVWSMLLATLLLAASGCKTLLLGKGYPDYGAQLTGLPVHGPVRVLRDANGIPHIYAQDRHDLLVAEGFVHAQDRLWQMETLRRIATGRLAEVPVRPGSTWTTSADSSVSRRFGAKGPRLWARRTPRCC